MKKRVTRQTFPVMKIEAKEERKMTNKFIREKKK